jgi:hypothetical protein
MTSATLAPVSAGNGLEHGQDLGEALRLVAFPVLLRRQADACAIGATAHVRAAEGAGAVPGGRDHLADAQAAGGDLRLDGSTS